MSESAVRPAGAGKRIGVQTMALLVDAYRELNAKKLFWITMVLSSLLALAMAAMGNNERGVTVLWWEIPFPFLSTAIVSNATFYKLVFVAIGFKIWLTWAATILALISTAGIIPDFVSGGAIELTLSKPASRLRLFLTKYMMGLLFVALQVGVFTGLAFLVIGLRAGAWLPQLFLAVPLVVLFFSYLFCITALVGLITRSTISALLTTIILWLLIFLVHFAETGIVLQLKVSKDFAVAERVGSIAAAEREVSDLEQTVTRADAELKEHPDGAPEADATAQRAKDARSRLSRRQSTLEQQKTRLAEEQKQQATLGRIHAILFALKTALPKTSETMELLNRYLMSSTELDKLAQQGEPPSSGFDPDNSDPEVSRLSVQKEMERIVRARSLGWIVGTSLGFEAVIVGIGAWIFVRRDF